MLQKMWSGRVERMIAFLTDGKFFSINSEVVHACLLNTGKVFSTSFSEHNSDRCVAPIMEGVSRCYGVLLLALLLISGALPHAFSQTTRRFQFNVEWKMVTRLCKTKQLLTVNGEYPGPTIAVNEGDNVEIKVHNRVTRNTTLHWHGIRQMRTGWADGPAYITQCPIRGGHTYTYKFTVDDQRGTLLWHAHYAWQRASVYGAFIIYPLKPYPFSIPIQEEIPLILGEWWDVDADEVEQKMMATGEGPESSIAYTINGLPGPLYPCSDKDCFIQKVEYGKSYMLRIINAALADELFFSIAKHSLTVVEVDAVYTKPFTTKFIMIAPGQTTTVLVTANQDPDSTGMFAMAARPYVSSVFPFNNSTTIGFLQYTTGKSKSPVGLKVESLPELEDTASATTFSNKIRSLASPEYPCYVPRMIDKRVITTISLNLQDCPVNKTCKGYRDKRFFASMNNQSFIRPSTSILESHYRNLSAGGLPSEFPEKPPHSFDYTGGNPLTQNMNSEFGTKVLVVPYGTIIEIVLQDTSFLNLENHPIHVHGHSFFIVGTGFGNFNEAKDPSKYNLVDPPERNTVAVPAGGWTAIRIKANNPGVWFIHCHIEPHTSWGMAVAFVVQNGRGPSESLLPPPTDLPSC